MSRRTRRARKDAVGHEETHAALAEQDEEEEGPSPPLTEKWFENILDKKLSDLKKDLATKACIESLKATIEAQDKKIAKLEANAIIMQKYMDQLEKGQDEIEQYQRRLSLRINGIELKCAGASEPGEKCLEKVKEVFKELNVDVPDLVLDRAHRIGKVTEKNGRRYRPMIVRFTTWRHRTAVYRARKASQKYKIHLDITKHRLRLMEKAKDLLNETEKRNSFAFADVNCRMCLKLDDKYHYFETEEDLLQILCPTNADKCEVISDSE